MATDDVIETLLIDVLIAIESLEELVVILTERVVGISDSIDTEFESATAELIGTVNAEISTGVGSIEAFSLDTVSAIEGVSLNAIDNIANGAASLSAFLNDLIGTFVGELSFLYQDLSDSIQSDLDIYSDAALVQFDTAANIFTEAYEKLLDPITQTANAFAALAVETPDAIEALTAEIGPLLARMPKENYDEWGEKIEVALKGIGGGFKASTETSINEIFDSIMQAITLAGEQVGAASPETPLNLGAFASGLQRRDGDSIEAFSIAEIAEEVLGKIWVALGAILSAIPIFQARAIGIVDLATQEGYRSNPTKLPDPLTIIIANMRGTIPDDIAVDWLHSLGYNDNKIAALRKAAQSELSPGETIAAMHRGFISQNEANIKLQNAGYDMGDSSLLQSLGVFVPGVQDLITMAVREVFSPDIASAFGLFEDLPFQFVEQAKKHGLTEEVAEWYWGAHWNLPSPLMGFRMLHRRIIDEDELKLLMRALDIMPFWRDKLIQLSYNPLTRVDVRRMFSLDVLTEEEVFEAYLDIGYNETNAARLTEFTKVSTARGTLTGSEKQRDLSTAQVLRMYKSGLLGRVDTSIYLEVLGYTPDDAELLILREEIQSELDERDEEKKVLEEMVLSGAIDLVEAQAELASMEFAQPEISLFVAKMTRKLLARAKLPSLSDLEKMYKEGIINKDETKTTLQLLGYSEKWADNYMALFEKG